MERKYRAGLSALYGYLATAANMLTAYPLGSAMFRIVHDAKQAIGVAPQLLLEAPP